MIAYSSYIKGLFKSLQKSLSAVPFFQGLLGYLKSKTNRPQSIIIINAYFTFLCGFCAISKQNNDGVCFLWGTHWKFLELLNS